MNLALWSLGALVLLFTAACVDPTLACQNGDPNGCPSGWRCEEPRCVHDVDNPGETSSSGANVTTSSTTSSTSGGSSANAASTTSTSSSASGGASTSGSSSSSSSGGAELPVVGTMRDYLQDALLLAAARDATMGLVSINGYAFTPNGTVDLSDGESFLGWTFEFWSASNNQGMQARYTYNAPTTRVDITFPTQGVPQTDPLASSETLPDTNVVIPTFAASSTCPNTWNPSWADRVRYYRDVFADLVSVQVGSQTWRARISGAQLTVEMDCEP
ncbi:MAG: hypothetical protein AB2A00_02265 [Myxococcota bacterium]